MHREVKTPRELVAEMHRLVCLINTSAFDPRYIGWSAESRRADCQVRLEAIQRQVRIRRCDGVMSKAAIRGILGQVCLTSSFEALNWLQTELERGIVAFNEDAYEERRSKVASLFVWYARAVCPITDGLVNEFYWLLGSSFDDLGGREGTNV